MKLTLYLQQNTTQYLNMKNIKVKLYLILFALSAFRFLPYASELPLYISKGEEDLNNKPLKEIVEKYYTKFYLGTANHAKVLGRLSGEIADREFNYITPSNDFKQTYIHPTFNQWQWEYPDLWIEHTGRTGQLLRLHSPISPQCSKWVKEDNRTAEELSRMLDEYLTQLCVRYAHQPQVRWMDVVNETIAPKDITDPLGNIKAGDWFAPREGTDKWENPWTILGFDESHDLHVPLYIDRAFEITNQYAPRVKQIINQHGAFEEVVWEKMKELVHYLRETKGRRVDGIGWQAHIDAGWEKVPGNLERLEAFIRWCHANHLEFHITEMNVWLKDGERTRLDEQAETFGKVLEVLLANRTTGVVGLNFWNVRDEDTANPQWIGALWNNDGTPKPAYHRIKQELINYRDK